MALLEGKLGGNFQGPETSDAPVPDQKFQRITPSTYGYFTFQLFFSWHQTVSFLAHIEN